MNKRTVFFIVLLILLADQALKVYIKTTFRLQDSVDVFGDWFKLYFVENPGMAYGWKFGGEWGKVALTLLRIGAVIFGTWYIGKILKEKKHSGFIFCAAMIYAGAIGNLIDSCFYGMIFDKGMLFDPSIGDYRSYNGLAHFSSEGYSSFLHGNVVDMLYFPLISGHFPDWLPIWGGEDFEFFRPVFNIADAAISVGIITILVFQKRFFPPEEKSAETTVETQSPNTDYTEVH